MNGNLVSTQPITASDERHQNIDFSTSNIPFYRQLRRTDLTQAVLVAENCKPYCIILQLTHLT